MVQRPIVLPSLLPASTTLTMAINKVLAKAQKNFLSSLDILLTPFTLLTPFYFHLSFNQIPPTNTLYQVIILSIINNPLYPHTFTIFIPTNFHWRYIHITNGVSYPSLFSIPR